MLPKFIARRLGYSIDPEELNAYRSVIPNHVLVNIDKQGRNYVIRVKTIDDKKLSKDLLVTQARNQDEIVDMINDLVLMYRDVPEDYRPYFKRILTPEGNKRQEKDLVLVKG